MPLCLLDLPVQAELEEPILFQCDKCDFRTKSQQGVDLHKGTQHQEQQKPVDKKNNDEQSGIKHFRCDHFEEKNLYQAWSSCQHWYPT